MKIHPESVICILFEAFTASHDLSLLRRLPERLLLPPPVDTEFSFLRR